MFHRVQRQVDAGHRSDFARPQAGRIDEMLGEHRALFGDYLPTPVFARVGFQHPVAQHDLGALHLRRLRVGLRGTGRIQVAVERIVERAEHAIGIGDRTQLANFHRRDQLCIEPHVAVHRTRRLEEIETLRRFRERYAADVMQAAGLAGDFFQLTIQADGITLQGRHVGIRVQGMKSAGSMPGRTRGQLGALDQQHVAHTEPGQVINDAAADDATTDYYYLRMTFHNRVPKSSFLR